MLKKSIIFLVSSLVALQFIPLDRTNNKVDTKVSLHTDSKVSQILKKSCYDCHSDETKWSSFAYIAPLSFGVVSHVSNGRETLNFSKWKTIPTDIKKLRLQRAIKTISLNRMPLPSYTMFHKEAKLSNQEKDILKKWFESELEKIRN